MTKIYHITPGYRSVIIWKADDTGQRISTSKAYPLEESCATKKERYDCICTALQNEGLTPPDFKP